LGLKTRTNRSASTDFMFFSMCPQPTLHWGSLSFSKRVKKNLLSTFLLCATFKQPFRYPIGTLQKRWQKLLKNNQIPTKRTNTIHLEPKNCCPCNWMPIMCQVKCKAFLVQLCKRLLSQKVGSLSSNGNKHTTYNIHTNGMYLCI
jgi:hypothetical protein